MLPELISPAAWLTPPRLWLALGFFAQAIFAARFLVQWIASERARASVVPVAFWYFSLAGGLLLLVYAIYRRDPVFIMGQAMGAFIYARNIYLIRRARRCEPVSEPEAERSRAASR